MTVDGVALGGRRNVGRHRPGPADVDVAQLYDGFSSHDAVLAGGPRVREEGRGRTLVRRRPGPARRRPPRLHRRRPPRRRPRPRLSASWPKRSSSCGASAANGRYPAPRWRWPASAAGRSPPPSCSPPDERTLFAHAHPPSPGLGRVSAPHRRGRPLLAGERLHRLAGRHPPHRRDLPPRARAQLAGTGPGAGLVRGPRRRQAVPRGAARRPPRRGRRQERPRSGRGGQLLASSGTGDRASTAAGPASNSTSRSRTSTPAPTSSPSRARSRRTSPPGTSRRPAGRWAASPSTASTTRSTAGATATTAGAPAAGTPCSPTAG